MLPQYENLLLSSFLLWINNRVQQLGQAYYDVKTNFYPIDNKISNYITYAAPYSQFISDSSISGAHIMTGVHVNGVFLTPGTSPLVDINFEQGQVYFDNTLPNNAVVSGHYALKELNVAVPSVSDPQILFESKMTLRPIQPQQLAGLESNLLTYPIIFVKNEGGDSKPFTFGGVDQTRTTINAYVFAESQFQLDAVCSILKDSQYKYVPLFNINEFPYNNLGGFKSGIAYNYNSLTANKISNGYSALIEECVVTDWGKRSFASEVEKFTTASFFSFVEFTLWTSRVTK